MAAEVEPSPHRYLTLVCAAAVSLSPTSPQKMTRMFYMTMLVFNDLSIFLLNIALFSSSDMGFPSVAFEEFCKRTYFH